MNLESLHRIHGIGIGGIGVSALCRLFVEQRKVVSGSDASSSIVTDWFVNHGIDITIGDDPEKITPAVELVIHSLAIPQDHPEMQRARELGIPIHSYPEVLGEWFNPKKGIGVSGTNGKTTTTALLGLMMVNANLDPTVVVGGRLKEFDGNARLGSGDLMVIEADEYGRAFHHYKPHIAVVTNIEADHLDIYKDIHDIAQAFLKYCSSVPQDGLVVGNVDDQEVRSVMEKCGRPVLAFGFGDDCVVRAVDVTYTAGETNFRLLYKGNDLGICTLHVPGDFNVRNALAAAAVALHLNVNFGVMKETLKGFTGTWRRFQVLGAYHQATVVSDYAHHPTSVQKTITAARDFYPKKRIVAVFQPHHHHRTRVLHDEFVQALTAADVVIVPEIFKVEGRTENEMVSSRSIVRALKKKGIDAHFVHDVSRVKETIDKQMKPNDVIIMMGAGDIYKHAEKLV